MFGPPDPIVPVRGPARADGGSPSAFQRRGFVSLWAGSFASVEEAEAYFGIPDEIGVYLPPEAFAADWGLGNFPSETLEVNFEQVAPRPLAVLLRDATFAASFQDQALAAADRQGIHEAQGVALLFDFDYRLQPARPDTAGPLRFVGAFPFVQISPRVNLQPFQDLARELGYPVGAVLFVLGALADLSKKRKQEQGSESVQLSAREYCTFLLGCRGEDTAGTLRELGLKRSEDVGRIMFGLINAGLARGHESDTEADFQGLFALE